MKKIITLLTIVSSILFLSLPVSALDQKKEIIKLGDNDMAKTTKGFFKMEMLLLKIISEGDCYGYQIVQTLDKISNGTIHIAEGTMYPILYRLLDEGLISDEKRLVGKRQTRIYYHIEDKGIVHMQKLYEEYLAMINSIERIMENKYESE